MDRIYSEGNTIFYIQHNGTKRKCAISILAKRAAIKACVLSAYGKWWKKVCLLYPQVDAGDWTLCAFQPDTFTFLAYKSDNQQEGEK